MLEIEKYDFSFTASSLRLNDMKLVAKSINDNRRIDYINELGGGKTTTGKRMLAEFQKRISKLTSSEIEILLNGDFTSQKQIAFVSICRAYYFIRDFAIEVLREKLLVYDYKITDGDYISFYRRKQELQPEMETLTELTEKKIRQVTFKILEQAGLIDNVKSKIIQTQLIDSRVLKAVTDNNSNWLKVLLMSDMDIALVKE